MLMAHEMGKQRDGSLPSVGAYHLLLPWGLISFLFAFSLLFAFSTAAWAFGSCFLGGGIWLDHHKEQSLSLVFSSLG